VKLLSLVDRLPVDGMDAATQQAAIESVTGVLEQIKAGEIHSVVFVALDDDNIYQGNFGAWNDVYRLTGALQGLTQYLLQIYHVDELNE